MRTCDRGADYPGSQGEDISVLSWNLLAPLYDKHGLDWEGVRLPELRRWLQRYVACDVMCFQEVDRSSSLAHISQMLTASGFVAVVQERKGFPVVNATFFKASRLRHAWSQHRSRALLVGLVLADGREVCVANVHLEAGGGDRNEKQREDQLTSVLKRVRGSTVVCGDFNSCFGHGSRLETQLVDAGLARAPTKGITLAQADTGYADILDHIWASKNLVACLVLGSKSGELDAIRLTGIPNATHPSDHLPVAATFTFKPSSRSGQFFFRVPVVDVPAAPGKETREEWLQICWFAGAGAGKRAAREQKQLEAAFLEILGAEDAANLRDWRKAASGAAKDIVATAVKGALEALRAVEFVPVAQSKAFDPGGVAERNTTSVEPNAACILPGLRLGGA